MASARTCLGLLKLVLIFSGMVSIFIFCKIYVAPFILELSNISQFLVLWNSILNFLKPLYLFVVINFIIIIIVASSRYNNLMINTCQDSNYAPSPAAPVVVYVPSSEGNDGFEEKHVVAESGDKSSGGSSLGVEYGGDRVESDFVVLRSKRRAKRRLDWPVSSPEIVLPADRPFLFSSRSFRERPVNSGGFQGARPRTLTRRNSLKQQFNTLEDTWKAITNDRCIVESNNTWQGENDRMSLLGPPSPPNKKTETFMDRLTPSHVQLRKEPSLSQDEVNQRAEMFIRKFNEQMRLQRQQSLEQLHEMINRGL